MLIGQKGIKYGLTVPASKNKSATAKPAPKLAAFGDDDSDGEHEAVPQQLARQAASKRSNTKVAEMHAAAMAEDPSVFDYDGVYDSMQETKAAPVAAERKNRSSKYIESLLDKAKEREREQDIIFERRQVKEREVEDHLFGDKEKFVTAAYKKKLQERQLWEAEQKLKDKRDEDNAGHTVGDMSGFYGNLLTKNVAFGASSTKNSSEAAEDKLLAMDEAAPAESAGKDAAPPVTAAPRSGSSAEPVESPTAAGKNRGPGYAAATEGQIPDVDSTGAAAQPEAKKQEAAGKEGKQLPEQLRAPPVRRTDSGAAAAARERYLARKRKAAGEPDP